MTAIVLRFSRSHDLASLYANVERSQTPPRRFRVCLARSAMGTDPAGDALAVSLEQAGVSTDYVMRCEGRRTSMGE